MTPQDLLQNLKGKNHKILFLMLWKSSFIVEPRYNKPQYNEVLGMTNDSIFFATVIIVKYVENNLDITKPHYNKQSSLSAPWPFVISWFHRSQDRLKPLSIHQQRKITSSLYSHCEKGRKTGTRQFAPTCGWFWLHLFSKKFERTAREAMDACLRVLKESNKSRLDRWQCQEQCIHHIPYCLSGIVPCTFFPTTFLEIAVQASPNWNSLWVRKWPVYKVKNSIKAQEMCKLSN